MAKRLCGHAGLYRPSNEELLREIDVLRQQLNDLTAQLAAAKRDADCLRTLEGLVEKHRRVSIAKHSIPNVKPWIVFCDCGPERYGQDLQSAIEAAGEGE